MLAGAAGLTYTVHAARQIARLRDAWTYTPLDSSVSRAVGLNAPSFVPLDAISPLLVLAVVSSEDRHFFRHRGFDLEEIQAALRDALHGQRLRGASTISQQLVKNLFLSDERTIGRKLREGLYTILLEHALTKRDILALYLDTVEWGRGIYGATAATAAYFGTTPAAVNLEQAALLAALLPLPRERGRALDEGSVANLRPSYVLRLLLRLHLVVSALRPDGSPRALALDEVATAPLDAIIDPAEASGYPRSCMTAAHRSMAAIRTALHATRSRLAAGAPAPAAETQP